MHLKHFIVAKLCIAVDGVYPAQNSTLVPLVDWSHAVGAAGPKVNGNSFTCTQNVRETENIPQNYSPISQLRFLTVCWSWLWQSIPRINGCRNTIFQRKIQILTQKRIIIILATSKLIRNGLCLLKIFLFQTSFPSIRFNSIQTFLVQNLCHECGV